MANAIIRLPSIRLPKFFIQLATIFFGAHEWRQANPPPEFQIVYLDALRFAKFPVDTVAKSEDGLSQSIEQYIEAKI